MIPAAIIFKSLKCSELKHAGWSESSNENLVQKTKAVKTAFENISSFRTVKGANILNPKSCQDNICLYISKCCWFNFIHRKELFINRAVSKGAV